MFSPSNYEFAKTAPETLKSPWWIGHIPFVFELIKRQSPDCILELGTYSGSSFYAFCQAVELLGLKAKCFGVDLWEGDIHMGQFEESLYKEVLEYSRRRYPDTAILVREEFNSASGQFPSKSIDLLHIDGTHTFEAVTNDYHTWLPKLSDRGVILFHDTNVTRDNVGTAAKQFGVKRFFDSVKESFPHIEFKHCYGLGVLMVGKDVSEPVLELVEDAQDKAFYSYFEKLGGQVSKRFEEEEAESMAKKGANSRAPVVNQLNRRIRSWLYRKLKGYVA